jgi:hypothetical protein
VCSASVSLISGIPRCVSLVETEQDIVLIHDNNDQHFSLYISIYTFSCILVSRSLSDLSPSRILPTPTHHPVLSFQNEDCMTPPCQKACHKIDRIRCNCSRPREVTPTVYATLIRTVYQLYLQRIGTESLPSPDVLLDAKADMINPACERWTIH